MPPEPVKILAVDDVPENLVALEALLRRGDVELLQARSATEALELLLVHDVALALLDVQMPGMDGFELAELMRGTERTRRVPIIFLTAVATDERRTFRGYEAGAVDYLFKPVDPHIVRSKVDIFVELFRQRRELARQRDEHAAALARLHAHSDNSPLAIVEFDADERIIAWSKGAERMFGWRAAEVAGFRPAELSWLEPEDLPAFAELVAAMVAGGQSRVMRVLRMRTAEGVRLECECYCSALVDAAGRLTSLNMQLLDITERRRAEDTQRLLIGELNHRVKNTLASVQAIATQTLRHSTGPSDFAPTFIGRIHSLARAHALLSSTTWQGASLRELVQGQLHTGTIDPERLSASGPDLDLAPELALHLALVLHELTTNANKYGALSRPEGRVDLSWRLEGERLELLWRESGGPPVTAPSRKGFGSALIERSLKAEGGSAVPDYRADGVRWTLTLPYEATTRVAWQRTRENIQAAGAAAVTTGDAMLSGRRFLVIEDEPLVAMELTMLLRDAGAEVIGPAANATQALELIATAPVDAALLDGNLQGAMVDDIARALERRAVPFLFVSGYTREHLPPAFAAVAIVNKPFEAGPLIQAAAGLLVRADG